MAENNNNSPNGVKVNPDVRDALGQLLLLSGRRAGGRAQSGFRPKPAFVPKPEDKDTFATYLENLLKATEYDKDAKGPFFTDTGINEFGDPFSSPEDRISSSSGTPTTSSEIKDYPALTPRNTRSTTEEKRDDGVAVVEQVNGVAVRNYRNPRTPTTTTPQQTTTSTGENSAYNNSLYHGSGNLFTNYNYGGHYNAPRSKA